VNSVTELIWTEWRDELKQMSGTAMRLGSWCKSTKQPALAAAAAEITL